MEAKTGSAENQNVLAHAWFVGYTPPEAPRILILVMVEGRGDSHQIASPMARQLMDILLPNDPNAVSSPTPSPAARPTATPTPAAKPSATPTVAAKPTGKPVATATLTLTSH
jgi:hypothetical protein